MCERSSGSFLGRSDIKGSRLVNSQQGQEPPFPYLRKAWGKAGSKTANRVVSRLNLSRRKRPRIFFLLLRGELTLFGIYLDRCNQIQGSSMKKYWQLRWHVSFYSLLSFRSQELVRSKEGGSSAKTLAKSTAVSCVDEFRSTGVIWRGPSFTLPEFDLNAAQEQ